MSFDRIQRAAFQVVSQTGIHYRDGPLSQSLDGLPNGAPRAGDRFPWLRLKFQSGLADEDLFQKLEDTRFNLIVIGQRPPPEAAQALGDLLRIHVVPVDPVNDAALARARIPSPSFYLVRPDGHVGICGVRLEAATIADYVSGRLGVRVASPAPRAAISPA